MWVSIVGPLRVQLPIPVAFVAVILIVVPLFSVIHIDNSNMKIAFQDGDFKLPALDLGAGVVCAL